MDLRRQRLTRFVAPLREGGSLPALGEADDGFRYVVKLRGAGHGVKALVAELIGGLVAKALKLDVPEVVLVEVPRVFGITEPDQEVQELLAASRGLNVGLHFLEGAATFDPAVNVVDPLLASKIVWLDAFLTNVDRTRLNPNLMVWRDGLWLIDNGASLYFHHAWTPEKAVVDRFPFIKDHVLLPYASRLEEADRLMRQAITPRTLGKIVDLVPAEWLEQEGSGLSAEQRRGVYKDVLRQRLAGSRIFVDEAIAQRNKLLS